MGNDSKSTKQECRDRSNREKEENRRNSLGKNRSVYSLPDNANYDPNYVTFIPMQLRSAGFAKLAKGSLNERMKAALEITKKLGSTSKSGFKRRLTTSITKNNDAIYISLPSKPLQMSLTHSYQEGQAVQLGQDAMKSMSDFMIEGAKAEIAKAAQSIVQKFPLANTILNQIGVNTFTPQRAFYSGTAPISLKFNWVLSPKNPKEGQLIKQIVTAFKILSMPQSFGDPADAGNETSLYLRKNPAVWRIDYDNGAGDIFKKEANKILEQSLRQFGNSLDAYDVEKELNLPTVEDMFVQKNSFDLMVCDNVDVTYGEGEFWTTFEGGFPNTITLSLSFKQLFPVATSEDIFGYNPLGKLLKNAASNFPGDEGY